MKEQILIYNNSDILFDSVAKLISEMIISTVKEKEQFNIALSGGSTPEQLYKSLLKEPFINSIPWHMINFFFSDERYLPENDEDTNYMLAEKHLFSQLSEHMLSVFTINNYVETIDKAAKEYEIILKQVVKNACFDLILLGVGNDGHVASLFPDNEVLEEKEKLVSKVFYNDANITPHRITMTYSLINKAKNVLMLVSGDNKKDIVTDILSDKSRLELKYPANRLQPEGKLIWALDFEVN